MKRILTCALCWLSATAYSAPSFDVAGRTVVVDATREDYVRYRLPVPDSKITAGQAEALIDAPAADVVEVLRQYSEYRNFLPFFTDSQFVKKHEDFNELRLKAKILHGTVSIDAFVSVKERTLEDQVTEFDMRLIRGNIERLDSRWTVYPVSDNRSMVVFYLMVDPDLWFAKNTTLSEYNWVNCGRTVRALRERVLAKGAAPGPATSN